jgi:putative transposase
MIKTEYQRNLPHFHHIGASFFVTWRLYDSLPYEVIEKFKIERDTELTLLKSKELSLEEMALAELRIHNQYFLQFDNALDKIEMGLHCLKNENIANIIADKLKSYDGLYYSLEAYCIMSNHVHALFDFSIQVERLGNELNEKNYKQLSEVMRLIKGGTSRAANKILTKQGSFWEEEYFDRYIRNANHKEIATKYILNNPVKAKICQDAKVYPYNYCKHW